MRVVSTSCITFGKKAKCFPKMPNYSFHFSPVCIYYCPMTKISKVILVILISSLWFKEFIWDDKILPSSHEHFTIWIFHLTDLLFNVTGEPHLLDKCTGLHIHDSTAFKVHMLKKRRMYAVALKDNSGLFKLGYFLVHQMNCWDLGMTSPKQSLPRQETQC